MAKTLTLALAISATNSALTANSGLIAYLELTGATEKAVSYVSAPVVATLAAGATGTFTPPAGGWSGNIDVAIACEYVAAVPDSTITLDATALILRRGFMGVMDTSLTITNNTASSATYSIIFWKEA